MAFTPSASPLVLTSEISIADTVTMGMSKVSGLSCNSDMKRNPCITGVCISTNMMSGLHSFTLLNATAPIVGLPGYAALVLQLINQQISDVLVVFYNQHVIHLFTSSANSLISGYRMDR